MKYDIADQTFTAASGYVSNIVRLNNSPQIPISKRTSKLLLFRNVMKIEFLLLPQ